MATTKEQERQALKKIRSIVESLGEDSYIATAFDGVWEIAEENIENDFAGSCKWFVDKANAADEMLRKTGKDADEELAKRDAVISKKAKDIEILSHNVDVLRANLNESEDRLHDAEIKEEELNMELDTAKTEIMKLKAKLFDLMFQGE